MVIDRYCERPQLHPEKDIDQLLDLPTSEISDSVTLNAHPVPQHSSKSFSELKYPGPPHLSPAPASDEDSLVDSAEEAEDLAHVELEKHFNCLFVDEKRFFGQARCQLILQLGLVCLT